MLAFVQTPLYLGKHTSFTGCQSLAQGTLPSMMPVRESMKNTAIETRLSPLPMYILLQPHVYGRVLRIQKQRQVSAEEFKSTLM